MNHYLKSPTLFLTLALCLALNLLFHNPFLITVGNTIALFLSLFFCDVISHHSYPKKKIDSLVFGALPLFYAYPRELKTLLFILLTLSALAVTSALRKKQLIFLLLPLSFVLSLYINGIIKIPFSVSYGLLLSSDHWSQEAIISLQNEALYLPYRLRPLIFNSSVYLYTLFANMIGVITLKNLYDVLLLANLYPLTWGVVVYSKIKGPTLDKLIIIGYTLVIASTSVISRSVNNLDTFLLLSPILIYLLSLGLEKINRKLYLILLIFSYHVFTSPIK